MKKSSKTSKNVKKGTKKCKPVSVFNIEKYKDRVIKEAEMIAYGKHTVRSVAQETGVSKSAVHRDCTLGIKTLNSKEKGYSKLMRDTRKALDINKAERHIRGGEATKQMYKKVHREKKAK